MVNATRSGRKAPQEDEIERARREKREGKKKAVAPKERKKGKEARSATGEEQRGLQREPDDSVIPKPYGVQERIRILERVAFLPMRYPHKETMEALGIQEDVEDILEAMELDGFMKKEPPTYRAAAIHFLASLEIIMHPESAKEDIREEGAGYITFEIEGKQFRMSIREIEEEYGFNPHRGLDTKMDIADEELAGFWETISSSKYEVSKIRGGHIRNPAIRYAHKALTHTLFARQDGANVTKGELEMLDISILDHLETLANGKKMDGDRSSASIAMVMLNSFKQCMRNAIVAYEQGRIGDTSIAIGSMITPILKASRVRLPHFSHYSTYMDISYLNKTWFLKGTHNGKHIYRFQHPSYGACKILLPNEELTDFKERSNIMFLPSADELYMDGGDATIGDEAEPSHQPEAYHFTPYNAQGSNPAIQKAHEHIRLLQEWCKQQEKTIKKLVRTVKTLKAKLSCTPRASDMDDDVESGEETVSVRNKRKRRAVRSPTPDSTSHELEEESSSSSMSQ